MEGLEGGGGVGWGELGCGVGCMHGCMDRRRGGRPFVVMYEKKESGKAPANQTMRFSLASPSLSGTESQIRPFSAM